MEKKVVLNEKIGEMVNLSLQLRHASEYFISFFRWLQLLV